MHEQTTAVREDGTGETRGRKVKGLDKESVCIPHSHRQHYGDGHGNGKPKLDGGGQSGGRKLGYI